MEAAIGRARRQQRALLLSATAVLGADAGRQGVVQAFRRLESFEGLVTMAEAEGMAPLLRAHLSASGLVGELPENVRRALSPLHLRHRTVQASYTAAMQEVVSALRSVGVDVLLMKGSALAHLVYPEPALRPMRDCDLLVSPGAIGRAVSVLKELGYTEDPESKRAVPHDHYHVPALGKQVGAVDVYVELHTRLGIRPDRKERLTLDELIGEAQPVPLGGHAVALTLGPEDLLWLVYRHAFGLSVRSESFRLIWIADLVHLVTVLHERIDWPRLEERYPQLVRALAWLHFVTPWSEPIGQRLRVQACAAPDDVGEPFSGWPRGKFAGRDARGRLELLRRTLAPPTWWLHVRFGSAPGKLGYARSWTRHLLDVL